MKVVVLGGSGFIGRHVVAELRRRGAAVVVASREPARLEGALPAGVAACGLAPSSLGAVLDGADAVINLAGTLSWRRWDEARKAEILSSRLDATNVLARALAALPAEHRPRCAVNASCCWYGDTGDAVMTERSPAPHDFLGRTCAAWERAATGLEDLGLRLVIARLGLVFGRGGGPLEDIAMPFRMYVGAVPGSGRRWMSWVHVDDVVALLCRALEDDTMTGPYNVTSPEPCRVERLCDAMARTLERPSWGAVPAWGVRIALGEMADYVLASVRALPERALACGYRFRFVAVEDAIDDLLGSRAS